MRRLLFILFLFARIASAQTLLSEIPNERNIDTLEVIRCNEISDQNIIFRINSAEWKFSKYEIIKIIDRTIKDIPNPTKKHKFTIPYESQEIALYRRLRKYIAGANKLVLSKSSVDTSNIKIHEFARKLMKDLGCEMIAKGNFVVRENDSLLGEVFKCRVYEINVNGEKVSIQYLSYKLTTVWTCEIISESCIEW